MIGRMRIIALVGAGAISSAAICSLYLACTLEHPETRTPTSETPALGEGVALFESRLAASLKNQEDASNSNIRIEKGQSFLVAFLADADPQVRTLAAWGLLTEAEDRQSEILEFIRRETEPEVRASLYRYLQGQRTIECNSLIEIVKNEEDLQTWLAGCDLLADAVQNGADEGTVEFFNKSVVPLLKNSAINGHDLHARIAAIIVLRRARTPDAIDALREIISLSTDAQVVKAATCAIQIAHVE